MFALMNDLFCADRLLCVILQAAATETVEAATAAPSVSSNGNGTSVPPVAVSNGSGNTIATNGNGNSSSNGRHAAAQLNGNGNGNGNGKAVAVQPSASSTAPTATTAAHTAATAAPVAPAAPATPRLLNTIDEEQDAQAAGQLELAAATAGSESNRTKRSAAGTPYKVPGGSWSKFKTYSVWQVCAVQQCVRACLSLVAGYLPMPPCAHAACLSPPRSLQMIALLLLSHAQRTCEIWTFAVTFAWRYFLLGRKWTYPKRDGGMTPEAVSARKRELAVWLREALVRLGPTFIKCGQQARARCTALLLDAYPDSNQLLYLLCCLTTSSLHDGSPALPLPSPKPPLLCLRSTTL